MRATTPDASRLIETARPVRPSAVVVGSVFRDQKQLPNGQGQVETYGGVGHNVAYALARTGMSVRLVTLLDDSAASHTAGALLHAAGIRVLAVRMSGGLGTFRVAVEPDGEVRITGVEPPPWDKLPVQRFTTYLDGSTVDATLLCIELGLPDGIVRASISTAMRSGSAICGIPTRRRDIRAQRSYLADLDHLCLNRLEASQLLDVDPGTDVESLAKRLRELGPGDVLVTADEDGAYAMGFGSSGRWIPSPQQRIVDTTGAGDALAGCATGYLMLGDADPIGAATSVVREVLSSTTSHAHVALREGQADR